MKNLFESCKPRQSVFDETKREDTLDLSNLNDNSINAEEFFKETYVTEGMNQLFDIAFRRFDGNGANGIVRLSQSMGGGKTHLMLSLGLLAKKPEIRKQILGNKYKVQGEIRVVSFTGRESDIPYGIWGEIARQLNKEKEFEPYYTPLKAPGQSSWINLLKGEPLLILLDEIPPYLDYAKTIPSGTGTLADITTNALSNLFNALGKSELANVCLVISDLRATYESGTELLEKSFKNLDNEISRSCINIEPVGTTSDDLYHILRTRLFETLPKESEIIEIATSYKDSLKEAKQMNYTNSSPDQVFLGIKNSYPFHPSIKDLFARFKENQGFQQTRGFIRLTRAMVKCLYFGDNQKAKGKYLINAFDIDLNDNNLFSIIKEIKPKLSNAIARDISNNGTATAEIMDKATNNNDMQDLSKLILVSSLSSATNAVLGLSMNEAIGYMASPGRDITSIKASLEEYKTRSWYMYINNGGKLYFRDVKNVNAELISLVDNYTNENAKQEIKKLLQEKFNPKIKDCYQEVLVFPGTDEINLKQDKITLVLFEPNTKGAGLQKDLREFYENETYKNRVMFLTGQRNSMDILFDIAKRYKAINSIINRMKHEDKVLESDTQYLQAQDIQHKVELSLLQACRDTFVTLYYPTKDELVSNDITMKFEENKFDAEAQIKNLLVEVSKFDKDTTSDTFRRKFEARIFTTRQARWVDLKERVATTTAWSWHHPSALEDLKNNCIKKGLWIEQGGYLDKEPPKPETGVLVREVHRNDEDGVITLKLIPQNGDTIYYEINGDATTASLKVSNHNEFKTNELSLSFLCVDSTGEHNRGSLEYWKNKVIIQYRIFDKDGKKHVELKTHPKARIKYTTDGSSPKESGGLYDGVFEVLKGTKFVQAIAFNEELDVYSDVIQIAIKDDKVEINKDTPLTLYYVLNGANTAETYKLLEGISKHNATMTGVELQVFEKSSDNRNGWADLSFDDNTEINPSTLVKQIDAIRENFFNLKNVEVSLNVRKIKFSKGSAFEDWIAENRQDIDNYKTKITQ